MPGASDFVIEGYVACGCGRWVVPGTRLCSECRLARRAEGERLKVMVDGEVVVLGGSAPRHSRRKPYRRTNAGREARRRRDRAEKRALRALARLHPDEYAALVEAELAAEGMTEAAASV